MFPPTHILKAEGPHVTIFGKREFQEVRMVNCGGKSGALILCD